jgi:hypothetical protein
VKVELEGCLAEEDGIKPQSILHNKGVGLEANQVLSAVGFAGELTDEVAIRSGSKNAKMQKGHHSHP